MARVIWSPQTLADLGARGDFLAREAPAYAQAVADQAFAAVECLEIFPYPGRIVPEIGDEHLREIISRNYRIMYIVSGNEGSEEVQVLTVLHASRQFGS